MSDPQLKIHYDLAKPGSEKQVTYVQIPEKVALLLDQHRSQHGKIEQVNVVLEGGRWFLALVSSCNFTTTKEEKEEPTTPPDPPDPASTPFCVYGVDATENPHLIRSFAKPEWADEFIKCCVDHDAKKPENPLWLPPKKYNKWRYALRRWAKSHPAGNDGYVRYFSLPQGAPVRDKQGLTNG